MIEEDTSCPFFTIKAHVSLCLASLYLHPPSLGSEDVHAGKNMK